MIDFTIPEDIQQQRKLFEMVAKDVMRPYSRYYDEHEHEIPWEYVNRMWPVMKMEWARRVMKAQQELAGEKKEKKRSGKKYHFNLQLIYMVEMLSWGDAGIYLCTPGPALAGFAIDAAGTPEQKVRFLKRFAEGDPKWGAMAITEPGAGSDVSAISTTAVRDGDEWVINGEKIFITNGWLALEASDGLVVVWATVDKSAGRAGIKSFIVPAGTPGAKVTKREHKLGIRASDTAALVFEDCRIPLDNVLGNPEVEKRDKKAGFKAAMVTFDTSRPVVAASALGIGRAAIEFVKEKLAEQGIEIPYNVPKHKLTAVQRDVLQMEAMHKMAWLLTLRAAAMSDERQPNALEASMAKVKAGKAVTWITQKAVELLGPLGYSTEYLAEKWMRDAKINDIFEGTGQINTLIVARRILGYSSRELK
ncbi:MAG: acyl-CoA dehydrogenase [Chloroflexi bacterium]|nr:acyl-CoA dehydrogenase [Chloroflexota bacterium]